MKIKESKEKTRESLSDICLEDISGGKNTVNFIHEGKTTCTLVVEGKKIICKSGDLKDVPKNVFVDVMTTKDNLKFSKEEAEEIYKRYTV